MMVPDGSDRSVGRLLSPPWHPAEVAPATRTPRKERAFPRRDGPDGPRLERSPSAAVSQHRHGQSRQSASPRLGAQGSPRRHPGCGTWFRWGPPGESVAVICQPQVVPAASGRSARSSASRLSVGPGSTSSSVACQVHAPGAGAFPPGPPATPQGAQSGAGRPGASASNLVHESSDRPATTSNMRPSRPWLGAMVVVSDDAASGPGRYRRGSRRHPKPDACAPLPRNLPPPGSRL